MNIDFYKVTNNMMINIQIDKYKDCEINGNY